MDKARWVRVIGDGLAWSGPCLLTHIILCVDTATDYVDIYDGRNTTSGKKFACLRNALKETRHINFSPGVRFDVGIYLDANNVADETTVVFVPL